MPKSLWNLIVVILAVENVQGATYTFSGIINGNTPVTNFTFTIPISSEVAGCIFRMPSSSHRNVLMMAKQVEFNYDITRQNISQLYLADQLLASTDLSGAINGDSQLANVHFTRKVGNIIYMSFFNLDLPSTIVDKPYQLIIQTIDYFGIICFSCPIGMFHNSRCYCQTCLANYYGKRCNYFITTMEQGQTYSPLLNTITNVYFRIQDPPQIIDLYYSQNVLTHNIYLYIQFQQLPGDLAGDLNSYHDSMNKSYSKLVTITENNFTINTGGRNLMITVTSKNNGHSTNVILFYQNHNKSVLGLILGLTLGFTGVVVVIIVIVCCCKRCRKRRMLPQNSFYLTRKQINLYYPEVEGKLVLNYVQNLEQSYSKINPYPLQSQNESSKEYQCVICLSSIDADSKVRVTFCKHVFHGHCLMKWFQKNQVVMLFTKNCPFCRSPCNREPSLQKYDELKAGRKRKFTARELVTTILGLDRTNSDLQFMAEIKKEQALVPSEDLDYNQEMLQSRNTTFQSTVKSSTKMKKRRSPNRRQPGLQRQSSLLIQQNNSMTRYEQQARSP